MHGDGTVICAPCSDGRTYRARQATDAANAPAGCRCDAHGGLCGHDTPDGHTLCAACLEGLSCGQSGEMTAADDARLAAAAGRARVLHMMHMTGGGRR